jgi:digeranylgeranylglycerophospholipid reductase
VSASPTEARLEVRCNGTGTRALHAQVVVLACGFSPSLTARAGLGAIPDFAIGAQARVELKNLAEAELYLGRDVAPGFFAWAVPTGEGEGLVGLLARRGARPRLETLLSRLHEAGKLAAPAGPVLQAPVPLRPLRRSYGPRLLVVGDAAGHVKPTSGGGIYYSLLGAEFAAQTIVRAAGQGDFSRRGLSTYEELWKKRLAREFRVGHWARRIFERLSDPEIEEILDAVVANGVHETVLRSEQYAFDWHARVILDSLQHPVLGRLLGKAARAALLAQARRLGTPG